MSERPLTIAIGNYGLTRPLKEATPDALPLQLEFVEIEPVTKAMRRMVRSLDLDICEMAFTTYLCARDLGVPITAIPVFLTRNFHHWAAFAGASSGINSPKDLEWRRVAVNRGYTVTTGLWVRGILQHECGVDLDRITWVPTDEEHVTQFVPPSNVDMSCRGRDIADLLASGNCAAAIGDVRAGPDVARPLIPDARQAGFAYYRKTGIYPLNHAVVIRNDVLQERPQLAAELCEMFAAAKAQYLGRLASQDASAPADVAAREVRDTLDIDPFAFGIDANRKALEAIVRFALEQRVITRAVAVDDLFAPSTRRSA
jgi:4,5-dihydroxyphthalate decarboxylase